jgi:hypothetical protein
MLYLIQTLSDKIPKKIWGNGMDEKAHIFMFSALGKVEKQPFILKAFLSFVQFSHHEVTNSMLSLLGI